jgi:hypothetical protein
MNSLPIRGNLRSQIDYIDGNLSVYNDKNSNKYILSGFSPLQEWGVWSVGNKSSIVLNLKDVYKPSTLSINGKTLSKNMDFNSIKIFTNEIYLGECSFSANLSTCNLPTRVFSPESTILKSLCKEKLCKALIVRLKIVNC